MAWYITLAFQLVVLWILLKFSVEVVSWILSRYTGIKLEVSIGVDVKVK